MHRSAPGNLRHADPELPLRLLASASSDHGVHTRESFEQWLAQRRAEQEQTVLRVPFSELGGWYFEDRTGDLRHESGRFFSVRGLAVTTDSGPVRSWSQPIINQPEIGVLGILVREIDGVLHCLMQAKVEPGNANGVQLSPTVQATKSNYTRVHRGSAVPYLEHFKDPPPERVVADVLQSEQGAWFYQKRNRNMVVEVGPEVEAGREFCWLTLGQLTRLLSEPNLVNMDARTVLSCLPYELLPGPAYTDGSLSAAVARSSDGTRGGLSTTPEILSWITSAQAEHECSATLVPLNSVERWKRGADRISHENGVFFSVIGVDVTTENREVAHWSQPLLEPHGVGLVCLLVARFDGVLHGLINARVEPGYLDVVELAGTVQYTPRSYEEYLGERAEPHFLDALRAARPEQVLFDCELSEEGGRFYQARSRYVIVEVDGGVEQERPDFRWMTLAQLTGLLRFSHYLNVQLRTLVAALRGLG